jgi:hypothetical protein
MKAKLLSLVLIIVLAVSITEPIFAVNPQLEDTKIAGTNGQPLQTMTVHPGDSIELQARLYWYWHNVDTMSASWIPQICRYLDFYVYKANPNGTNGDIVWSDSAITNFFTANANPDEFTLTEKGTYNLVVKYEGNLKHSNATAKILVA